MPDEAEMFLPAQVIKAKFASGEAGTVKTEDGEVHNLDAATTKSMTVCNEEVLSSAVDNLIKLNDLNEQALLHNLRIRFKEDVIYTYVSTILISVNPFKLLPLYTPEILDKYKQQGSRDLPPHVYAIGDNAYRQMLSDAKSQSVVISGESGAGKTEATKLILQFMAEVSGRAQTGDKDGGLEQQILQANPIMEAFGNAKTLRNNNSSRFGKLISVAFNGSGAIVGGSIINYLLEKVRVVRQLEGERNYHIFYQVLAGCEAHPELQAELQVLKPDDYLFLSASGVTTVDGMSDEKEFEDVMSGMDTMNFDADYRSQVLKIVAAVLFLGNLQFEADVKATEEDGAKLKDGLEEPLERACTLLGIDEKSLSKSLLSRNIGTRSVILVSYNAEQATDARDALCKHIYSKVFDSLIKEINLALAAGLAAGGSSSAANINVLDIFGFETFETNSFEQLCINYCNEKLQNHFNEHIFKLEQAEYAAQGVVVADTDFVDNSETLEFLEKARTGVFAMLDEEISVPKGSDEGFLGKVFRDHAKHPRCQRPKPKELNARMCFTVVHFAGEVPYNVTGFLDKNKDSLHADIQGVIKASSQSLIKTLFAPAEEAGGGAAPARGARRQKSTKQPTLGAQFKKQLQELLDTLNSTSPHFVRTMKSNDKKRGDIFDCQRMLDQLRYSGLLEVCRIRQIGFPVRSEYDVFFKRFNCLVDGASDIDTLCTKLTAEKLLKDGQWQKGKSKMFMRNLQSQELEEARDNSFSRQTVKVQRAVRAMLMRSQYTRYAEILTAVKGAIAARGEAELTKWMDMSAELPYRGEHIAIVKQGRTLMLRLQEEKRVDEMLDDAMKARVLEDCEAAIAAAGAMSPPYSSDSLSKAKALLAALTKELELKAGLTAATKEKDLAKLTALLAEADAIPLDSEEVHQARVVKQRLDDEAEAVSSLSEAISTRSLTNLNAWLSKMQELGLEDHPQFAAGTKLKAELTELNKAKLALESATQERDLGTLQDAIARASKLGYKGPALDAASALEAQLKQEEAAQASLTSACETRDLAKIKEAVSAAEGLGVTEANSAMASAKELIAQLEAEIACRDALKAATASNSAGELSKALGEASKLGLTGAEVDAARTASAAQGASSAARQELSDAAASGDADRIRKAMQAATAAGESSCPEITEAGAALDRLNEEEATMKSMSRATAARDREALAAAVATAAKMGLEKKFPSEVAAAKALSSELDDEHKVDLQLKAAQQAGSIEDLENALKKAADAGVDNAEVKYTKLFKDVMADLNAAMESKEPAALRAAIAKADSCRPKVNNEKVEEARMLVDRDSHVATCLATIAKASASRNIKGLNQGLEKATQLGLTGDEIDAARKLQEELAKSLASTQGLRSAIRATGIKANSPAGISPSDIKPLSTAIEKAQAGGIDAENDVLKEALVLEAKLKGQIEVQGLLATAIGNRDYHSLKEALDRSDDLVLKIDAVGKARAIMREVDAERRRMQAAGELEEDEIDEEEVERERQERLKKAANAKYHFTNYANIRSVDDFAKGIILSKKKIKESMLKWQSNQIPKSLLEMDKDLSKLACRVHKSILGYMGDKTMSFPATLAQDILQKGLDIPEMVDEIYMLIMKQLTNNPKPESIARGWQLMCMCVGTFPPSREFENHLLNYILEKKDSQGAVGNYARYSLRRLEGMLSSGASGFVPSVEEIQSYKERPPILSTIELVDGTPLTEELPVTPDLNVGKVLEICTHFLDLQVRASAAPNPPPATHRANAAADPLPPLRNSFVFLHRVRRTSVRRISASSSSIATPTMRVRWSAAHRRPPRSSTPRASCRAHRARCAARTSWVTSSCRGRARGAHTSSCSSARSTSGSSTRLPTTRCSAASCTCRRPTR